jgi:hypothetical protein
MTTMLNQIERACLHLAMNGQAVTIAAVAEIGGVSRSTIYRNEGLRAVIEHHRHTAPDKTITALTEEIATLRATVMTLAEHGHVATTPRPRRLTQGWSTTPANNALHT